MKEAKEATSEVNNAMEKLKESGVEAFNEAYEVNKAAKKAIEELKKKGAKIDEGAFYGCSSLTSVKFAQEAQNEAEKEADEVKEDWKKLIEKSLQKLNESEEAVNEAKKGEEEMVAAVKEAVNFSIALFTAAKEYAENASTEVKREEGRGDKESAAVKAVKHKEPEDKLNLHFSSLAL